MDGTKLTNSRNVWKSNDDWNIQINGDGALIIENVTKNLVLGASTEDKVVQEAFVAGKPTQLWRKGKPNSEGFYTLENFEMEEKLLTASSASCLQIKGI